MSAELSTTSKELQQEAGEKLLKEYEGYIARAEIMEAFYQSKMISGEAGIAMILGKTQAELKEWRSLLAYLKRRFDK